MRLDVARLSVAELRRHLLDENAPVSPYRLRQLSSDSRAGVRRLAGVLRRRLRRERLEQRRRRLMVVHESGLWEGGVQRVAGVDEVGVGPLAGPVVAAAVILHPRQIVDGVDDSKKLDCRQRSEAEGRIRSAAVAIGIGEANVAEIDRLNVYHAGLLAMRRAVGALEPCPEHVLVDARTIPGMSWPQQALVGGDGCSQSIAAASIIAKTHRDRLMDDLAGIYPDYGFDRHRGYCTPDHQLALQRHGICPEHRRSFKFLREATGGYSRRFYELRETLSTVSASTLDSVAHHLESNRTLLSVEEYEKLRLLLVRRKRRFTTDS